MKSAEGKEEASGGRTISRTVDDDNDDVVVDDAASYTTSEEPRGGGAYLSKLEIDKIIREASDESSAAASESPARGEVVTSPGAAATTSRLSGKYRGIAPSPSASRQPLIPSSPLSPPHPPFFLSERSNRLGRLFVRHQALPDHGDAQGTQPRLLQAGREERPVPPQFVGVGLRPRRLNGPAKDVRSRRQQPVLLRDDRGHQRPRVY